MGTEKSKMYQLIYQNGLSHTRYKGNSGVDEAQLCQAYQEDGNDLPLYLDGEYAFVLYHSERDSYFCARDPLGIKPLYYTKTDKGYLFSATVDQLLHSPGVMKKPNIKSMRTILYEHSVDYHDTMYEGIYRLPPGHFMAITNGQIVIERYWYPEKIEVNYTLSEEEAAQQLRSLFEKAVDKRIENLEETAFEVSGGLDSSSVVSLLAQKEAPAKIDSYSMDFGSLKCDEGAYVDELLGKYTLHHTKVATDKLDYEKAYSLERLYSISPNWPVTLTFAMDFPMLEQIKKDGKRVVVTGQGGDHLFAGTPEVLYALCRRWKLGMLYRELRLYQRPWGAIKGYLIKPLLGQKTVNLIKKLLGRAEKISNPFTERENEIENLTQRLGIVHPVQKYDLDTLTSAFYTTLMDGNSFHSFEEYFEIEYRHPFFDKELVEFALSLPGEMKYRNKTIKWIWRRAMDGILPEKIRKRTDKAEFSEIILQQIAVVDLNELLKNPYIVRLGLIEQSWVDRYKKAYEEKRLKYVIYLWMMINVEYWYRYNFEESSRC
jgi:asparagine synthase (glutamine-hydrolysing)